VKTEDIEQILTVAMERVRPAYLTREDVARELGISRITLLKLEENEGAPVHHLGGNIFRYLRSELDEWIVKRLSKRGAA
jgi:predicted DNA-binding transcriptional regulator AlpA